MIQPLHNQWIVINPNGYPMLDSRCNKKTGAIEKFCKINIGLGWKEYSEMGFTCKKVTITCTE